MIKYSEFIDCLDGRILSCPDFKVKATTLDGLIDKIRKSRKYNKVKNKINSICIYIESIGVDNNFVFLDDVFMYDSLDIPSMKKLISSIARSRFLIIAPDLSEIYSEEIHVANKNSSIFLGVFDYSLMYGDYEKYTNGCKVKIPLFEGLYRNSNNGTTFIIDRLIHDPETKMVTKNDFINGIYCMYEGNIYDDAENESGWVEEADTPIPVSLFKPIKE